MEGVFARDARKHSTHGKNETHSLKPKPKPRPAGNIYAIKAQGLRGIKIGYAKDVGSRLKSLQTGCPVPLEVVTHIPADPWTERSFHRHLAHERVLLEWFDGPDTDRLVEEMRVTHDSVYSMENANLNPVNLVAHFREATLDRIIEKGRLKRTRPDLHVVAPDRDIQLVGSTRTPESKTLWRPSGKDVTMSPDGDVPWTRRPDWMDEAA